MLSQYILIFFYVVMIYKLARHTMKSLTFVKHVERHLRDSNMLGQFRRGLQLKRSILRGNLVIADVYFLAVLFGLLTHATLIFPAEEDLQGMVTVHEEPVRNLTAIIFLKELVELAILTFLFINVRPRTWPQFYSLEIGTNQLDWLDEML